MAVVLQGLLPPAVYGQRQLSSQFAEPQQAGMCLRLEHCQHRAVGCFPPCRGGAGGAGLRFAVEHAAGGLPLPASCSLTAIAVRREPHMAVAGAHVQGLPEGLRVTAAAAAAAAAATDADTEAALPGSPGFQTGMAQ